MFVHSLISPRQMLALHTPHPLCVFIFFVSCVQKVLSDALGVKGEVRKDRQLFMIGQTRVHLDTVEGLGHFMELEVQTNTHTM